jgi:hypothetical protein
MNIMSLALRDLGNTPYSPGWGKSPLLAPLLPFNSSVFLALESLNFLFYLLGAAMLALWVHQDLRMMLIMYLEMEALRSMSLLAS